MKLAGLPPPSGRVIDGTLSLYDAIVGDGRAQTRHAFLPLYNNPVYGNASRHIYAGRYKNYKAHWITSPGLTPHSATSPSPSWAHAAALIFDVDADPSEAFPLAEAELPVGLRASIETAKVAAERRLTPTSISMAWGYEHALCCGVGCTPPCTCRCKGVPLPVPAEYSRSNVS